MEATDLAPKSPEGDFAPSLNVSKHTMLIPITEELQNICKKISDENLSVEEWCSIESDDMFQSESFIGGFDGTEKEFTFSYFDDREFWFQFSLVQANEISKGAILPLEGRIADK